MKCHVMFVIKMILETIQGSMMHSHQLKGIHRRILRTFRSFKTGFDPVDISFPRKILKNRIDVPQILAKQTVVCLNHLDKFGIPVVFRTRTFFKGFFRFLKTTHEFSNRLILFILVFYNFSSITTMIHHRCIELTILPLENDSFSLQSFDNSAKTRRLIILFLERRLKSYKIISLFHKASILGSQGLYKRGELGIIFSQMLDFLLKNLHVFSAGRGTKLTSQFINIRLTIFKCLIFFSQQTP